MSQSKKHQSKTSESDLVEGGRVSKLLNDSLLNCSISEKERSQTSQQLKQEIAKVTLQLNKLNEAQRIRKAGPKSERISLTYRQTARKSINSSLLNPVLKSRNKSPNITRISSNSQLNTSRDTRKNDSYLNSSRGNISSSKKKRQSKPEQPKKSSLVSLNLKPQEDVLNNFKPMKGSRVQKSAYSKYSPCTRSELMTPRLKESRENGHKSFDLEKMQLPSSQKMKKDKNQNQGISQAEIYAAILDFPPKNNSTISIFEPERAPPLRDSKIQENTRKIQEIEQLIVKERRVSRSPKRKHQEVPLEMNQKIEALMASVEIRQMSESDEEEQLRTDHTRLTIKHYTNNTIPEESADGDTSYMSSTRPQQYQVEEKAVKIIQRAFRKYREIKRLRTLEKKKTMIENILRARSSNTANAKKSTGGLDRALLTTAQIVRETSAERQKKRVKKHAFKVTQLITNQPSVGEHSPGRKMTQKIQNYKEACKRRKSPAVRLERCLKPESIENSKRAEGQEKQKMIRNSLLRSCAASLCATQLLMWRNMMQHFEEKK